jgi:hypothetical protein
VGGRAALGGEKNRPRDKSNGRAIFTAKKALRRTARLFLCEFA